MKCKDIDALLDAHGIGALSAAAKAEVTGHLEQCWRCADAWLGHEALAGETPAGPRAGFYDQALATAIAGGVAVADEAAVAGGSRRWRSALGLAAASVIAAGTVWLALPDEQAVEQGGVPVVDDDSAESSSPGLLGDTLDLDHESGLPPAMRERLERQAESPTYVDGVHYETLAAPAPTTAAEGQVEICEFFMFGCIHCFAFEPILTSWVESRADSVDFVRVPAMFNDIARLHAQAYYTAEALGVVDTIVGPFYSEIHERGQMLASVDEIRKLFASLGVDAALFDSTFDSFGVRASLRRAEELNRLYGVDSTPTIGIAGKYRTNVSMSGSNEVLFEVLDALVETETLQGATSATSPCEGRDTCPRLQLFESVEQMLQHLSQIEPAAGGAIVQ